MMNLFSAKIVFSKLERNAFIQILAIQQGFSGYRILNIPAPEYWISGYRISVENFNNFSCLLFAAKGWQCKSGGELNDKKKTVSSTDLTLHQKRIRLALNVAPQNGA